MAEEITKESNYARRLAARRRADPSHNQSDKKLPMPRPFHWDYHPTHSCVNSYAMIKEALNTILPFEKAELIAKYRRVHGR